MIMKRIAAAGAALVLVLALTAAEDVTAVVGARVLTGTGVEIENGTVLIEGGRIKAVGKAGEVPVPAGARVVDARLEQRPRQLGGALVEPRRQRGVDGGDARQRRRRRGQPVPAHPAHRP